MGESCTMEHVNLLVGAIEEMKKQAESAEVSSVLST